MLEENRNEEEESLRLISSPEIRKINITETKDMHDALTNIAKEIIIFNNSQKISTDMVETKRLSKTIKMYKLNLMIKKRKIKYLNQSLKISCARFLASFKSENVGTLGCNLKFDSRDSKNIFNHEINYLVMTINNDIKTLRNIIEDEYINLQKTCDTNDNTNNLSTQDKLRLIIVNCHRNWTKFCDEHSKCEVLEQKNRYLNNKVNILESSLKSAMEALQSSCNSTLQPQKKIEKDKTYFNKEVRPNKEDVYQEAKWPYDNNKLRGVNLPVKRHLNVVRALIEDQNDLLTELKNISKEVLLNKNLS